MLYNEVEKIFEYGNSFEFPHTDSELIEINDTKLLLSKFTLSPLKYTAQELIFSTIIKIFF